MSRQNPHHLEQGWKTFEARVVPKDAPPVQRMCMRDGYYAGALVAFSTLTREVSDGDEITPADMFLMVDIDAELTAFRAELDERAAQARRRES